MAEAVKIMGLQIVIKNLVLINHKIEKAITRGLIKGGVLLKRESHKIVPRFTGNLWRSSFIRSIGGIGYASDIVVGYGTNYGVFVHERPNPPIAHGAAFNIKHAASIRRARASRRGMKDQPKTWSQSYYKKRRPQEQYKFLQQPLEDNKQEIFNIVTDEIRRAMFSI
jgi:hypothetical protein